MSSEMEGREEKGNQGDVVSGGCQTWCLGQVELGYEKGFRTDQPQGVSLGCS